MCYQDDSDIYNRTLPREVGGTREAREEPRQHIPQGWGNLLAHMMARF